MRHSWLIGALAATLAAALQAQQVATVVVQPDSLPGPQLVARNPEAPLQLRGLRNASGLELEVQARDPKACLRGVNASLIGGPMLAIEPSSGALLSGLGSVGIGGARGSGTSTTVTPPPAPPQNQPPTPPAQNSPQSSTRRSGFANLGLGVALGAALFDRLRERCEPGARLRVALPAEVELERLLIEVQLGSRAAPPSAAPASYSFGLRAADGVLLGNAPPLRAASP